jgi:hypothetical protein
VYHRRLGVKLKQLRERHDANQAQLQLQLAREKQREFCLSHCKPPKIFTAREAEAAGVLIDNMTGNTTMCLIPVN